MYVILLNTEPPPGCFDIWAKGDVRIAADGGANRLFDSQRGTSYNSKFPPHIIRGDLDSIRLDVRAFYQSLGSKIFDESSDQDSTDLQKCLRSIQYETRGSPDPARVLVLGGTSSLTDHTLQNLNTMLLFKDMDITMYGQQDIIRLLRPGRSVITPDPRREGPRCGVVALQQPAVVSSRGLKYDMTDMTLQFGGMQSTSNSLAASEVEIETDVGVLWITQLQYGDGE